MNHGVIIGRWQPLTIAGEKLIRSCLEEVDKLHIIIGSANKAFAPRNPFTVPGRELIFKETFPKETDEGKIVTHPVNDLYYNQQNWASNVAYKVQNSGGTLDESTTLFGSTQAKRNIYLNMFPYWNYGQKPLFDKNLRSSKVREKWYENPEENFKDLVPPYVIEIMEGYERSGFYNEIQAEYNHNKEYKKSWDKAPYAPIFQTVDNIVIKSGHILLIKRKCNPGKGQWAMPGGFADAERTLAEQALEELNEETRIKIAKKELAKYQKLYPRPFDYVYRSDRGRTITHVYVYNLGTGTLPKVKAADDAAGAFWVPIGEISPYMFEDHYEIIQTIINNL